MKHINKSFRCSKSSILPPGIAKLLYNQYGECIIGIKHVEIFDDKYKILEGNYGKLHNLINYIIKCNFNDIIIDNDKINVNEIVIGTITQELYHINK